MREVDVLEFLNTGADHVEILRDYPSLEVDDILACLQYAARQTDQADWIRPSASHLLY